MSAVNEPLPGQVTVGQLRDLLADADPHALIGVRWGKVYLAVSEIADHGPVVLVEVSAAPAYRQDVINRYDEAIAAFPDKAKQMWP